MSMFAVLEQHGLPAVLRLLAVLLAFVVLQLLRLPLLMVARVLEEAMRRLDGVVVAGLPAPPQSAGDGTGGAGQ
jgi:hypothetical protein